MGSSLQLKGRIRPISTFNSEGTIEFNIIA